jgi:sugar phosphate isomerase/epimerase
MAKITACSTLAFSLSSLEVALRHISDYGFGQVEIAEMLTHSKHFPIDTVDPVEVRKLLHKYSLKPVAANVALATLSTGQGGCRKLPVEKQSAAETEEIKTAKQQRIFHRLHVEKEAEDYGVRVRRLIDKAKIAGIPMVSIQAGRRHQIEDVDRELAAAAKVIDVQAEYAREAGIKILLEMPHVWDLYYDLEKSKQMLSQLQSDNIGVILDSTHWHTSGYDIDHYVRFLEGRLWHIHLRDAAGKDSPAGNYELEKTPGKGEVKFKLLGEALDKYGYNGNVTLETEYKNYKDPAEVDRENAYAITYLKSIGWEVSENR